MPVELETFTEYPTEVEIDRMVVDIVKFLENSRSRSEIDRYSSNNYVPQAHTEEEIVSSFLGKTKDYRKERLIGYALAASLKKGIERRFVDGKWYYGAKSQYGKWPSRDRD